MVWAVECGNINTLLVHSDTSGKVRFLFVVVRCRYSHVSE